MNTYTELEIAEGRHLQPTRGRCPIDEYYGGCKAGEVRIDFDLIEYNLAVGSVPITITDMDRIKEAGFDAVLDLCGDQPKESKWAKSHGIDFLHEFVHDGYSPTQEQFRSIAGWIEQHVLAGRRVYVHCHAGAGRAPTAMAAYLIYAEGMSVREALDVLREKRRYHIVSTKQVLGLRTFEKSIRRTS